MPEPRSAVAAPGRSLAASFAVFFSLLASPWLVFLRYHETPLARPEIALVLLGIAALCLLVAWLVERAGPAARCVAAGLGLALLVDLQIERADPWLAIAGAFLAGSAGAWLLRAHWRALVAPMAASALVASVLLPVGEGGDRRIEAAERASRDSRLPPILHIVLDEQVGVEGIPERFDPDASDARGLRDDYLERGFLVFGRAYGRYNLSRDAFSAFANRGEHTRYAGTTRRVLLARNAHFADLYARGYAIRVLQTDYLELCAVERDFAIEACTTRVLETPATVVDAPLSLRARLNLLWGMTARLSALLPGAGADRVSALSAMRAFDELERELDALEPGVLLFAHLMLPHFPFSYDEDCALRPEPETWAYGPDWDGDVPHYSEKSRARRYPLYLAQQRCTRRRMRALIDRLDASAVGREAWVFVHGDHGSRISRLPPAPAYAAQLDAADLRDAFSTLFAVRKPGLEPGYDRRLLPIDGLLEAAIARSIPRGRGWLQPPTVVLGSGANAREVPLPAFAREGFGEEIPAPAMPGRSARPRDPH